MLYTIVDIDEIFNCDKNYEYYYKKVDNCILQGVKCNKITTINRIISTNPKDYLNPDYSLGNRLF